MKNIPEEVDRAAVIELLMDHWGITSKADMARHLGVSRSSLSNYVACKSNDIGVKLVVDLMRDLVYTEAKLRCKQ